MGGRAKKADGAGLGGGHAGTRQVRGDSAGKEHEGSSPYGSSTALWAGRAAWMDGEKVAKGRAASPSEVLGARVFLSAVLRSLLDSCVVGVKTGPLSGRR